VPRASPSAAPRLCAVRAPPAPGEAEHAPRGAGATPLGQPSGAQASQVRPLAPIELGFLHSEVRPMGQDRPSVLKRISIPFLFQK
jgi:hypothetical protein